MVWITSQRWTSWCAIPWWRSALWTGLQATWWRSQVSRGGILEMEILWLCPAADRRVTSFYEDAKVTSILPLMTQPFDFKQRQSIVPKWEELLLFNDNFEKVFETDKNKNVVMFFEIIDFLPMSVANKNYNRYGQKGNLLHTCKDYIPTIITCIFCC